MKFFVMSADVYEVEAEDIDKACDRVSEFLSGEKHDDVVFVEYFVSEAP
jgi:hypothetical protein